MTKQETARDFHAQEISMQDERREPYSWTPGKENLCYLKIPTWEVSTILTRPFEEPCDRCDYQIIVVASWGVLVAKETKTAHGQSLEKEKWPRA